MAEPLLSASFLVTELQVLPQSRVDLLLPQVDRLNMVMFPIQQ